MDKTLLAIHAFVKIAIEEEQGVDYIERLSHFAQICGDDDVFELASTFFENDSMIHCAINFIEKIN